MLAPSCLTGHLVLGVRVPKETPRELWGPPRGEVVDGDIKLPDASDVTSRVSGKEKPRDSCDGDAGRVAAS